MPVTVNYCLSRNSVCCGSRKRRLPRFALVTVLALLLGTETLSAADSDQADGCEESDNLLLDPAFLMSGDMSRIWRYSQHTGEKSFSYSSDEGILQLERISEQPWMILKQRISNPRLSGARVRFSAKLKGDLPTEPPIHGFEHKAGLYFKAAARAVSSLSTHLTMVLSIGSLQCLTALCLKAPSVWTWDLSIRRAARSGPVNPHW